jgi:hypothetical protein
MFLLRIRIVACALSLVLALLLSGCAGQAAARNAARTLGQSVSLYESRLDLVIQKQNGWYDDWSKAYRLNSDQVLKWNPGYMRQAKSIEQASAFAVDPGSNVTVNNVVVFLRDTEAAEYSLYSSTAKEEAQAEADFRAALGKLNQQKDLADQIQKSLLSLAKPTSRAKDAENLSAYGNEVQKDLAANQSAANAKAKAKADAAVAAQKAANAKP